MKRCYKCGRIAPESKSVERRLKVQTGEDGWREAEALFPREPDYSYRTSAPYHGGYRRILGTDPAILCPKCQEAANAECAHHALTGE